MLAHHENRSGILWHDMMSFIRAYQNQSML